MDVRTLCLIQYAFCLARYSPEQSVTMDIQYLHPLYRSMIISIGHIFVLEIVNVYCLMPLIWRSILNLPLFGLFHIFIALNGMWRV